MYFIEYILKKIFDKKNKNFKQDFAPTPENMPEENQNGIENFEQCKHNFMPIDSTGETFACTNCGFVIKKEDFDKYFKNPFASKGL